jgi:peptidoglycan/xylan/chitin deacetylase (PgdA/CDA1 family)
VTRGCSAPGEDIGYATVNSKAWTRPSGLNGLRGVAQTGFLHALSLFDRRSASKFMRCVYLHTVLNDEQRGFVQLLNLIRDRGEVVSTDCLLSMIEGSIPIDGRYFHISFDDGFANVVRNAVPLLAERSMTACIFVATAFIGAPYEEIKSYCTQIMGYANPIEVVSWDDLRSIHAAGFEIGSHTHRHARLSAISAEHNRLMFELEHSKALIEREIGARCRSIAWPYGKYTDVDDNTLDAIRAAGYNACFSGVRGRVVPGRTDQFRIPRHQIEAFWPLAHKRVFLSGYGEHVT